MIGCDVYMALKMPHLSGFHSWHSISSSSAELHEKILCECGLHHRLFQISSAGGSPSCCCAQSGALLVGPAQGFI
jgi:hypothetical protein